MVLQLPGGTETRRLGRLPDLSSAWLRDTETIDADLRVDTLRRAAWEWGEPLPMRITLVGAALAPVLAVCQGGPTFQTGQPVVWTSSTSVLDLRKTLPGTEPSHLSLRVPSPTSPTTNRSASTSLAR